MRIVPVKRRSVQVGQRFGRLEVIGAAFWLPIGRYPLQHAVCRCECGKIKVVRARCLITGDTTSCGCYIAELTKIRSRTHGQCETRLYHIWQGMKDRCQNPKCPDFPAYGERGITVCDEWQGFVPFRDWAMSNGYREDLSIDRIDNDAGYSPGNCRFATLSQQNNNRRINRRLSLFGETKTIAEWTRDPRCKVRGAILRNRLHQGWSPERAIMTPLMRH